MISCFRKFAILLVMASFDQSALAAQRCERPDPDFKAFITKFKNDPIFNELRLITPLQLSSTNPSGKVEEKLSLKQIRKRKMQIIRGNKDAAKLKNTEGQLCEGVPIIKGNRATFWQSSCDTDVYSDTYKFVRMNGCWFLERIDSSGG